MNEMGGGGGGYWLGCGLRKWSELGTFWGPLDAVKSMAHARLISRPPARYLTVGELEQEVGIIGLVWHKRTCKAVGFDVQSGGVCVLDEGMEGDNPDPG